MDNKIKRKPEPIAIYNSSRLPEFMAVASRVKKKTKEWVIAHIVLVGKNDKFSLIENIAKRIREAFPDMEGALYISNNQQIVAFLHVGADCTPEKMEGNISGTLSDCKCKVRATAADVDGLKKLEITLTHYLASSNKVSFKRADRQVPVIMVVDDDNFIRSLISKAVGSFGGIIEIDDGAKVLDRYKKDLPDLVFLDIHLPGVDGFDLLNQILDYDPYAQIIMVSADSAVDKVLKAQAKGATWFLSKPVTKDKILAAMRKCPLFELV